MKTELSRMDVQAMELWRKHAKMNAGRRMEPDEFRFALDEFAEWLLKGVRAAGEDYAARANALDLTKRE